jgi:Flp pilus assembly protein TadB
MSAAWVAAAVAIALIGRAPRPTGPVTESVSRGPRPASAGWLDRRRGRGSPEWELRWLPLVLDLTAAGLRSGQPLATALATAIPPQLPWLGERLSQVAGMLRLGAEPSQAWQPVVTEPRLRPVAVIAIRSADSGIRLAATLAELSSELRASARARNQVRAQRVGVWVIAPLGLCFLPAFVCVGIVPVVIGIARSLRAGLPL